MPEVLSIHRSRRFADDHDSETPAAASRQRQPRTELPTSRAASRQHDANLLAFVQNATPTPTATGHRATTPPEPRPNDGVLYLGMNDESTRREEAALRATGASVTSVLRKDGAKISFEGVAYDLVDHEQCDAFARELAGKYGLGKDTGGAIAKTLHESNPPLARDELANIAIIFARGEAGASIPSRVVLSGHSDGEDIHMGPESVKLRSILSLARAMPKAAQQIEDIHFSGCFTVRQIVDKQVWAEAFPNLKSLWGYSGYSPSAPTQHLRTWEKSTRGRADGDPNRGIAGVTSWSPREGIRSVGGPSLARLRELQTGADQRFAGFFSGKDHVYGPVEVRIHQDYETYRRLSTHPGVGADEKRVFESRANALYFIRFYETGVRGEFAKEHGKTVSAGFESLSMRAPDFAALTREEALAKVTEFEAKLATAQPPPAAAAATLPILRGLAELTPPIMQTAWCH